MSSSMFLLYEYDIFRAILIISSGIPLLAFLISEILAPISKGPEKFSSYESGIEPLGDAWLPFRIRYYIFALVFVVWIHQAMMEFFLFSIRNDMKLYLTPE